MLFFFFKYLFNNAGRSRAYHLPLFHGWNWIVSRRARLYRSSPGGADVAEYRRQKHGGENSDDRAAADEWLLRRPVVVVVVVTVASLHHLFLRGRAATLLRSRSLRHRTRRMLSQFPSTRCFCSRSWDRKSMRHYQAENNKPSHRHWTLETVSDESSWKIQ